MGGVGLLLGYGERTVCVHEYFSDNKHTFLDFIVGFLDDKI